MRQDTEMVYLDLIEANTAHFGKGGVNVMLGVNLSPLSRSDSISQWRWQIADGDT